MRICWLLQLCVNIFLIRVLQILSESISILSLMCVSAKAVSLSLLCWWVLGISSVIELRDQIFHKYWNWWEGSKKHHTGKIFGRVLREALFQGLHL